MKERGSSLRITGVQGGFGNVDFPNSNLPIFQDFEKDPPYGREPLVDQVPLVIF